MKSKKITYNLSCTKEKALSFISTAEHDRGYIKSKHNNEYDIYLELYWENHDMKYVDNIFVGNIIDDKIIGEIITSPKTNDLPKPRTSLKEKFNFILEMVKIVLFGLFIILLFPYLILYAIIKNYIISLICIGIIFICFIIFIVIESNHIKVHKSNLESFIKPITKL